MKDEKKAPKLRFKGFTDDWEQCKLSDISEKSYEKNTYNKYSTVLTNSAEYGIVKQRDFFDKDIANSSNISGYYVVRKNYFVYNPRISNQAKFGPINRNKLDESGIMSPLYLVFTVHDIDESFLETLFQTTTWHRFMYQNGDTGARADRFAIKDSTFMSMPIKVPSLEEQHKLALAFQKLDQTITLHEKKKRQLERLKSALLKKMFADKSGYPAVRFKGFSDEWEQCKLGDISYSYSGGTPKAGTRKYYNGKIPFIRSGEISNGFTELTITEDGLRNSAAKMVDKGDILYALYGATSGEVSIARINGAINQAIMAIKPFEGYDSYLLASLLQNNKTKITEKYLQGGQGNLSATIVKNLKLKVPSSKEQKLIGILLLRLDRSITLYKRKLELLKRLKCSLLQNMFI